MPDLNEHYETWIGRMLSDATGHRIGRIDDIYTDDDTGRPEWLAVTTGLMGAITHFVPMRGATVSRGGVQVPFPKDQVKVAPSAGAGGRLSRMEKGRLYAHYGYSYAEERNRLQRSLGTAPPVGSRPSERREVSRAVELSEGNGPVDVPDVSRPVAPAEWAAPADVCEVSPGADRRDDAERLPPPIPSEGRGRWPDDEAIFGLSQDAQPKLAASGASRRR